MTDVKIKRALLSVSGKSGLVELGHALAYRFFGQGSQIVIYHFGGLAIPDAWGRRAHLRPIQRLVVSAATALTAASALMPLDVQAQAFPSRPLRLVLPFPPGGPTDMLGRALAARLGLGLMDFPDPITRRSG